MYICVCVCIHTWSELLVPLVNMIKEGCENKCALLILLIFYFKKSKLSLEFKMGGKYHYEMFFSQIHVGHNYWYP